MVDVVYSTEVVGETICVRVWVPIVEFPYFGVFTADRVEGVIEEHGVLVVAGPVIRSDEER